MNVFYIIIYIKILYKYKCKFIGIFKEYLKYFICILFLLQIISLIIFMIIDIIQ